MSDPVIDLTAAIAGSGESTAAKKRTLPASAVEPQNKSKPAAKKAKSGGKKETPHVLLWICAAGKGQGRAWKQKALKVVGIYKCDRRRL